MYEDIVRMHLISFNRGAAELIRLVPTVGVCVRVCVCVCVCVHSRERGAAGERRVFQTLSRKPK